MAKKVKPIEIEPRELFILLESLGLSMDTIKAGRSYSDVPRAEYSQLGEAHDLFLKLEETWDSLSDREREDGTAQPFDVRRPAEWPPADAVRVRKMR